LILHAEKKPKTAIRQKNLNTLHNIKRKKYKRFVQSCHSPKSPWTEKFFVEFVIWLIDRLVFNANFRRISAIPWRKLCRIGSWSNYLDLAHSKKYAELGHDEKYVEFGHDENYVDENCVE
jgi:hypothetical protein